jgi:hypothetical protein
VFFPEGAIFSIILARDLGYTGPREVWSIRAIFHEEFPTLGTVHAHSLGG